MDNLLTDVTGLFEQLSLKKIDSNVGLQEEERDWRDTDNVILTTYHCEHKDHVSDTVDSQQNEIAGT